MIETFVDFFVKDTITVKKRAINVKFAKPIYAARKWLSQLYSAFFMQA